MSCHKVCGTGRHGIPYTVWKLGLGNCLVPASSSPKGFRDRQFFKCTCGGHDGRVPDFITDWAGGFGSSATCSIALADRARFSCV